MMMGLGLVFSLVFLVLTIGLALWAIGHLFPEFSSTVVNHRTSSGAPLDILKQRYARGEISKGEYEEMRHALQAK